MLSAQLDTFENEQKQVEGKLGDLETKAKEAFELDLTNGEECSNLKLYAAAPADHCSSPPTDLCLNGARNCARGCI